MVVGLLAKVEGLELKKQFKVSNTKRVPGSMHTEEQNFLLSMEAKELLSDRLLGSISLIEQGDEGSSTIFDIKKMTLAQPNDSFPGFISRLTEAVFNSQHKIPFKDRDFYGALKVAHEHYMSLRDDIYERPQPGS